MSHPLRVRGLKRALFALIEMSVGQSHPLRVRGLKPGQFEQGRAIRGVAPFTGAWIETL